VLAHEGGYVNHPSDPGGPTNYGITLGEYSAFKQRKVTAAEVRAMPLADAKAIYRATYWAKLRGDDLPAGLDYAVFDYGVNSGTGRAAKVLQRICGLPDDGRLTDAVIAAVGKRKAADLIAQLCDERLAFLQRLKTWPTFGAGWRRRVAEVRAAALATAEAAGRKTPAPHANDPSPSSVVAASPAPGKGVVPVNAPAQKGATGVIVATGAAAAQQAHQAGLHPGIVTAVVVATAALALIGWLAWQWWQKRRQEAPTPTPTAPVSANP
jgi:lysozyme family protein